ncbi:MAG: AraC family transcriptional regulator, partial [Paenibacillus sp.]|nr:AraC family transcriptional regulator [Paenibacillus sp.]
LMLGASDYVLKMTVRPEHLTELLRKVVDGLQPQQESRLVAGAPDGAPGERYKVEGFFRDILTYRYTSRRIMEAAQKLGLKTLFERYALVVMELNMREALPRYGQDGRPLVGFSAVNMLEDIAGQEGGLDFFKLEHDEFVFIIDAERSEPIDRFKRRIGGRLERIAEAMESCLKIGVRFGVCYTGHEVDRLVASYREAKRKAQRYLFLAESERIVWTERTAPGGPEKPAEDDLPYRFAAELRRRLASPLTCAREEETLAVIEAMFDWISEDRCTIQAATACLTKAVSVVNLLIQESMDAEAYAKFSPLSEYAFYAGWNRERTKERLIRYCREYISFLQYGCAGSGRKLIREVVAYMREHYAGKITLEHTAKHFYMNKNYLSELFKAETGLNFTRYLNDIRIEQAKSLILQTGLKVTDISERVGFADFRYFSRVFKAYEQLSPSEFKARAAAGRPNR